MKRTAVALAVLIALSGLALTGASAQPDQAQGPPDETTICHVPPDDPENATTEALPEPAADAHLEQHPDDYEGECTTDTVVL